MTALLPRHGTAFGALLLTRTAVLAHRADIDEWVDAARDHGAYLAAAVDLRGVARALTEARLAQEADGVRLGRPLRRIAELGEAATPRDLAHVLLRADPPPWLALAVESGRVVRAYIPTDDLRALAWLEPDLDGVLLAVHTELCGTRQDEIRQRVGDAAEQVVLDALRHSGLRPVHVALLSDAFGYDIEVRQPGMDRIEVKGAGPMSRGTFHLSRNEYETGMRYGSQWRVVQVVFHGSAFVADVIDRSHVAEVLELSAEAVRGTVPVDTERFRWEESAVLAPEPGAWRPAGLEPSPELRLPGFAAAATRLPTQRSSGI
ncbi:DUF3883 domain-containing protein [Streptomyces sp.]|uniref:DUF3883 domain-containing protein n=1 Tax=Streptomyces sp. TaxID=1931 RepID=UPI002F92D67A